MNIDTALFLGILPCTRHAGIPATGQQSSSVNVCLAFLYPFLSFPYLQYM